MFHCARRKYYLLCAQFFFAILIEKFFLYIHTSLQYNQYMENLLIPQVVAETPTYLRAVDEFWDTDTKDEFKIYIGVNFLAGDIIPNTGGLRKIRWKSSNGGKRRGLVSSTTSTTRISQFTSYSLTKKMFSPI